MQKSIIIPINKNYDLSINHIGSKPEFAIKWSGTNMLVRLNNMDDVQQFTNFEELIYYVACNLDDLEVPHRVMNKEYS